MIKLNSNILNQFAQKGLSINEGIAIDARLVQSTSPTTSNDDFHKQPKKRNSPEGHIDKNRNPIKFQRDLESDGVVQNGPPHYGLKKRVSVDVNNDFVLAAAVTPASHHDSPYLPYCAIYNLHTDQKLEKVYADYRNNSLFATGQSVW